MRRHCWVDRSWQVLLVLGVQVSKDVDSGITHYVCIHVASEVTTKAARELDPTSPVALPKLPNGMAETPTARSAITFSHHAWPQAWSGNLVFLVLQARGFQGELINWQGASVLVFLEQHPISLLYSPRFRVRCHLCSHMKYSKLSQPLSTMMAEQNTPSKQNSLIS